MAFQDFDQISERRKIERQQKRKKLIIIAVVTVIILLLAAGAAFFYFVSIKDHSENSPPTSSNKKATSPPSKSTTKSPESPTPKAATPQPESPASSDSATPAAAPTSPQAEKAVKALCGATDFNQTCEESLLLVVKDNVTAAQPKNLLVGSISAATEEMATAVAELANIKRDTPAKTTAYDDCMSLLSTAKKDLNSSSYILDGKDIDKLSSASSELNNWLSAVLTYQDMCVDGFPEGEEKIAAAKALQKSEEHTINSLAIISQLSSILSSFPKPDLDVKRHLLTTRSGIPKWMNHDERRMLKADDLRGSANMTVAKDGSGNCTTISEALKAVPLSYEGRFIIYVKEGVYEENVVVTQANLTICGDGSQKSIITGSKNIVDDLSASRTATVVILGDGFMAQSIGFRNTAGPEKRQAVALRIQADRAILLNCRMEGFQGVIFAQTYRQFYRGCYITGTVDIIFGNAAAMFQNCNIYLKKPLDDQKNIVTAQGRVNKRQTTGIVLQNCGIFADDKFEADKAKFKSYLGRPSKNFSTTIVMETEITDVIDPEGWLASDGGDSALSTLTFGEYNNKGSASDVAGRVKWAGYQGAIKKEDALKYTVGPFLQGETWLKAWGGPVRFGLSS